MAANVENVHSNEKDGSLGSSDVARPHVGAARELDERRRAALSQVDNAAFSSVMISFFFPLDSLMC
jgi:hypothetical protein